MNNNNNGKIKAKVSLVIPMYYCADFIPTLFNQLCGQDYRNLEIICVVDGSPDNTLEILEKRKLTDDRIRIYPQEHKGAGAARNCGLATATGEYVMFPDADDDYRPDYVSRMVQAMEKSGSDIAICQFYAEDTKLHIYNKYYGYSCLFYPEDRAISKTSIKGLLKSINHMPQNKIFKREFLITNGIRFSETMSINDLNFSKAALISAETVAFVKDHLLTYKKHRNPKSISTNRGSNPTDIVTVFRQLYEWMKEKGVLKAYLSEFLLEWSAAMHGYAACCQGNVFTESIVKELTSEEPWTNMTDRELQNCTWLDCPIRKQELNKLKRKLKKARHPEEQKALKLQILFAEREIENCEEIKRRLQDDHGKDLGAPETVVSARIWQAGQIGPVPTARILYRKVLNRIYASSFHER